MKWLKQYKGKAEYNADMAPDSGFGVEEGHQIIEARQAVQRLVGSRVLGEEDQDWAIVMSGNATPGHQPAPDGSKEWITITITQK